MGSAKTTVMTHTQVNISVSPRPEIGVLLLELGVGLVSLVSHMHGKGEGHVVHAGVNCVHTCMWLHPLE